MIPGVRFGDVCALECVAETNILRGCAFRGGLRVGFGVFSVLA